MEQKTCFQNFVRYTVLSVLGTLGVSCYILADTFFIANGVGEKGLTALNLALPVFNFIQGSGLMLGMGGATRFSVCRNQAQTQKANSIYSNTICLAVIFSAAFFLLGLFFSRPIALLLKADNSVLDMTETYLRWLLLFSPAFILNYILLCFVRNDDAPQLAMAATVSGSIANILLDYLFIYPLKMGILGAVLATGSSPVISMIIMLWHWVKKKNTFHLTAEKPNLPVMGTILSLGLPSLITQLSSAVVMITFNMIILKLSGNTGVAAYGVVANIAIVILSIYTGVSQGMQPLASEFYGSGNSGQVREVFRYALATVSALSFVIYLLIFAFAQPMASLFNSENNMELQQIAVNGLRLYFLAVPFVGYNTILAMLFTSTEQAIPAQVLSVLRGFVLIIPLAFLLSYLFGMTGVWLTYPLAELLVSVIGVIVHRRYILRTT